MVGEEELYALADGDMDREQLYRGPQRRVHRQGTIYAQRRRSLDADQEGSAPAGFAVFQRKEVITPADCGKGWRPDDAIRPAVRQVLPSGIGCITAAQLVSATVRAMR